MVFVVVVVVVVVVEEGLVGGGEIFEVSEMQNFDVVLSLMIFQDGRCLSSCFTVVIVWYTSEVHHTNLFKKGLAVEGNFGRPKICSILCGSFSEAH